MANGTILGQTPTASSVSYNNASTSSIITGTNVQQAIDQLFQSVSNGKQQIASAITDKGVSTSASDSFSTMAENIGKIVTQNVGIFRVTARQSLGIYYLTLPEYEDNKTYYAFVDASEGTGTTGSCYSAVKTLNVCGYTYRINSNFATWQPSTVDKNGRLNVDNWGYNVTVTVLKF